MQAVILCAGNGTRLQPLTLTRPKPLIKLFGKSILEHNLEQLKGIAKEVILVVGYKGEMIQEKIGKNHSGLKIKYVWQKEPKGTGDAAKIAKPYLKDKFLLLNGDDFYFKEDLKKLTKFFPAILVKKTENPSNFAAVIPKNKNYVKDIIEKPKRKVSDLANIGVYYLPKEIFKYKIEKSKRGEYEFPDYLRKFAKEKILHFIEAKNWVPISFSWNLLDAQEFFFKKAKKKIEGKIEKGATIKGKLILGKGSIVRVGSYIIGPVFIGENCTIGPNCFIRGCTIIGNNCRIGQAVEIKNSIIYDNTNIAHLSYVGDSIIDEECNLGAGTIIANLRHDKATIKTMLNGRLIDTKRKKFGTIFGKGTKTGIGTLVYPGRKIWPHKTTLPGQIVKKDIK
ncbi:MAG: NTP transferase domain-containing protein [Candidatus Pacebacteria bacterium]|nr:NTP transferase domain-containing protein [Candidatus Paceibacterota bacterium]